MSSQENAMSSQQNKIFNDPIHGSIELHPLCVKIIDTPQFQRMRNIKQLGLGYFVYPGASHNRFEHGIGTCHLAKLMLENIQQRQPELEITKEDLLCIQIAGLCHDLGHGPFSHIYDLDFINCAEPDNNWKHENASLDMFDYLLKENEKVKKGFEEEGLEEKDIKFIKNLINPSDELKNDREKTGRGKEKSFFYEIIANKENCIDVDKWDYFARDCHHLGIKNNFDHQRLMKFARVIKDTQKDEYRIAYRDKTVENIYNMFHLRRYLHKTAYQHKVVKCITAMLVDALLLANEYITRIGSDGKALSISKSKDDMKAYSQLTDNIFEEILYSTSDELKDSRVLLQKILCRELYTFIDEVPVSPDSKGRFPSKKECLQRIGGENEELKKQLVVCEAYLDYGCGPHDPVERVWFYSKQSPNERKLLSQIIVSRMLPTIFSEKFVQVFVKDRSFKDEAYEKCKKWKEDMKNEILQQAKQEDKKNF